MVSSGARVRQSVQRGVIVADDKVNEAEKALRRLVVAEAKYRGMIDAAPDAIVIATRAGTIDLVNRQTEVP